MSRRIASTVSVFALMFALPASADDQATAEKELATSLATMAYVYGYPLVISAATLAVVTNTDKPLPNAHAPVNMFGHVGKLFTAADKDVVSSNVDTIYSSAFLDLKQGAALIRVGDAGDRYYSLMLEDGYTNTFGYIGSRATGTEAGAYLLTAPGWSGDVPEGVVKTIEAPTSFVWVIGRTGVDGQPDLAGATALQASYQIEMVGPALSNEAMKERLDLPVPDASDIPSALADGLDPMAFMSWMGAMLKDNPPPEGDVAYVDQFSRIGLSVADGFDASMLSEATKAGITAGLEAGKRVVVQDSLAEVGIKANGWFYNLGAGEWGTDYYNRAAIAYRSLGQNTAEEAVYMNNRVDADGATLSGDNVYTMTFPAEALPPVDAFWSITMYDGSNFFVDNPIDRYAIGDRTEGLTPNEDGSLTLTFAKDQPDDPLARANWLPAPEGDFRISMRLYVPQQSILAGDWTPPPLIKQ